MARSGMTIRLEIDGVHETLAAFRELPKQASDKLRDAAGEIAADLVGPVRSAARSDRSPQAELVASTVKVRRDRVPVLVVGGAKRLGVNRAPAYKLLFGSEFGSVQYRQFRKPHQGQQGSWFFPVIEAEAARISAAWNAAADAIIRDFNGGE